MRLERLEVGGFGKLDDFLAEFHPRLTVLVGENESGKSTVHRALRAALYGIDAGGPGRPTERSDWARWSPWVGPGYSLALTYALADGRRLRVARRLEQREQACQVQEVGGGDVTDQLRVARAVVPGQVHLGIDEAVFRASACVGEDALRLGAADTPAARATQVQEAIERLADSGSATTATEAQAALLEAARRVGSERRLSSPLGHAVNRLRQLDVQLDDARRRFGSLAAEEQRLRTLESDCLAAERRQADAQRRWLVGRLAALAAQRAEVEAATAEMGQLAAEIEGNAHFAHFPAELEDRVIVLAAELQEAMRSANEAAARAAAGSASLAEVRRRRREIGAGMRALGTPPDLDQANLTELDGLRDKLAEVLGGRRHGEEVASAARRQALRREIAATGLSTTAAASVDPAIAAVAVAQGSRRRRSARWLGGLSLVAGSVVAAVAAAAIHQRVAFIVGAVAIAAGLVALMVDRIVGGDIHLARRRLAGLCPGAALDAEGLQRLAQRLPRLGALYSELQREEIRLEAVSTDAAGSERRLAELADRAEAVAGRLGLDVAGPRGEPGAGAESRVRGVLLAAQRATGIRDRRRELGGEDVVLAHREAELERIAAEAGERAEAAAAVKDGLRRIFDRAGIEPTVPTVQGVADFRAGCSGRARHLAASVRLGELRRRSTIAGDPESVERLRAALEKQLRARDGDPAEAAAARPLAHSELQDLEAEAEHARQSAVVAATTAAALRARLGEMREALPPLADIEDERASCLAARDRAHCQLAALHRAAGLIEAATRAVHRDLAPRLAESVADRLALLTDGRYSAVNVDTAHFEVSLLGRDRPDLVPLELASHGTRDQVSLLLRLALAEVLSGSGEPVPLLLDEPLLSADPQRRLTALRFLWNLSRTNQVVLSTSDPAVVAAVHDCCGEDRPTVIEMPPAMAALEAVGRAVATVRTL